MAGYDIGRLNGSVFRNPLFLVCSFLYILHSIFRNFLPEITEPEFVRSYLNDLLFVPLALGVTVWLQRNIVLRQPDYSLSKVQVVLVVAYISLMFEGIIPFLKARYTADLLDVLCYGFGGMLFYIFGNAGGSNMVQKQP